MPQDYFLRTSTLRKCSRRFWRREKHAGKSETIEQIAGTDQDHVGIPLEIVRRSSPETLLQLLESGGALRYVRAVILAELLMQDSAVQEEHGKLREALIARAQAYALVSDALPHLPPTEQSIYRKKMELLRSSSG